MQVFESERLLYRPWQASDAEALVDGLNNINVSKWLAAVPFPYTVNDAQSFIRYSAASQEDACYFAVCLKDDGTVIGGISIGRIDRFHGTAGGGIWINESYHGHGYGPEAYRKRAEYAFDVLNIRRLESGCFAGNEKSLKMQLDIGFTVEGTRRKGYFCMAEGIYKDEIITALLRDDWALAGNKSVFG